MEGVVLHAVRPGRTAALSRQARCVVQMFGKKPTKEDLRARPYGQQTPATVDVSKGYNPAVAYEQEGKMAEFYLNSDVDAYFNLTGDGVEPLRTEPAPLPPAVVSEMWRYSDWHGCFTGKVEQKEEEGRRTEFVQFLFERLGERYKFFTRRNVAMRSRHAWGQVAATLSYPRGNFGVVHFVNDFDKWNTTENIGQYPKIWPKPHRTVYLFLDMAAHENYRIGVGPPRWGVVTDGRSWRIVEQAATETGAWDGRQQFRESATYHLDLPLTEESYSKLLAWLNYIFRNHLPIGAGELVPKWREARKAAEEKSDDERHDDLRRALAGLDDI
eukprot:TRINITY_DN30926_c0_g1_i1.p2 TRINITY_DN30926_c0_g1~~TRINITY_DN30926_c0_g1_i1.p2  ORF type:complete len:328 (+),score=92.79 TRINITY_DN30926_c0_g1_i1:126-1109(+)